MRKSKGDCTLRSRLPLESGEGGIRTRGKVLRPSTGLANRRADDATIDRPSVTSTNNPVLASSLSELWANSLEFRTIAERWSRLTPAVREAIVKLVITTTK